MPFLRPTPRAPFPHTATFAAVAGLAVPTKESDFAGLFVGTYQGGRGHGTRQAASQPGRVGDDGIAAPRLPGVGVGRLQQSLRALPSWLLQQETLLPGAMSDGLQ